MVRAENSQEVKKVQNPPDPDSKLLQVQLKIHSAFFPLLAMVESKELPQRKGTTPSTTRYFTVCKEVKVDVVQLTLFPGETFTNNHLEHVELQPEHCIETEDGSKAKVEANGWQGERQVGDVCSQSGK